MFFSKLSHSKLQSSCRRGDNFFDSIGEGVCLFWASCTYISLVRSVNCWICCLFTLAPSLMKIPLMNALCAFQITNGSSTEGMLSWKKSVRHFSNSVLEFGCCSSLRELALQMKGLVGDSESCSVNKTDAWSDHVMVLIVVANGLVGIGIFCIQVVSRRK